MNVTEKLREIAERLDANETERLVILAEIRELSASLGFDSPAPSLTPVDGTGQGSASPAPSRLDEPGEGKGASSVVTVGPLPAIPAQVTEQPEQGEREAARGRDATPATTPAPASPLEPIRCPQCDRIFKNGNGLSIHIGKAHPAATNNGHAEPEPAEPTYDELPPGHALHLADTDRDPRDIHENCPDCGQLFTWQPAFIRHKQTCRGVAATNRGGGLGE